MADPREKLGMMCQHGISPASVFGGIPSLTGLDVAAAVGMGHLTEFQVILLRAKYCLDEGVLRELWVRWLLQVVDKGRAANWPKEHGACWRLIAEWTLQEHIHHNACKRCRGVRSYTLDRTMQIGRKTVMEGATIDCPACHGTGKRLYTWTHMAHRMGLQRDTFRRRYQGPIGWCRTRLVCVEDDAVDAFGKFLQREELAETT